MPNGDRTGPNGEGPKTGRGLGKAIGNRSGRTSQVPPQRRNVRPAPDNGPGRNRNRGGTK